MQKPPADLRDSDITTALSLGWALDPVSVTHRPGGVGSHHWEVVERDGTRWFVTADELAPRAPEAALPALAGALSVATAARAAGLRFVVDPMPDRHGVTLRLLRDRYAVSLQPFVQGRSGAHDDSLSPVDVTRQVDLLAALHGVDPGLAPAAPVASLDLPGRASLEGALRSARSDPPAVPGPYRAVVDALVADRTADITAALTEHDLLVSEIDGRLERVLTHGQLHPGKVIRRADETLALVGWDMAALGPRERDVWMLDVRSGGRASTLYAAVTGRRLDRRLLRRYELAWMLADIAGGLETLRRTDEATEDTATMCRSLQMTMDRLARGETFCAIGDGSGP